MTPANPRPTLRAVEPPQPPETPLERARKRYGKPFEHRVGDEFRWQSGPSVLVEWLARRTVGRKP